MSAATGRRGDLAAGMRVVLLGGTSEIGLAIVGELQRRAPREVALVGRDSDGLARAAGELRERGCARVLTFELDARETERHAEVLERAYAELGEADIVVLAVGVLGEQGGLPANVEAAVEVLRVNTLAAGSLLLHTAAWMRANGGGALIVLSSVAAERPRPSNFVYGASKAGLDALGRGVGDALHDEGVRVLVVRPGFVRTRMTHGLTPAPLATDPGTVARSAVDGLERGAQVVWAPRAVRWPMLLIRLLPRQIFRRIKQ